ncbi:MAG: K(+)-transporting ATPase subunit C [Gaiellaceae bacterium]
MRRQLLPALLAFVVFTALLGIVYPLVITGISQLGFSGKANGSLVERDGAVVGSSLIGQSFTAPKYFHPRPSAAGDGYDGTSSSASNLGPSNPDLLKDVTARLVAYRTENGLAPGAPVPVEAVTSSASGLDPHISPADAKIQAMHVARERNLALSDVLDLVSEHTDGRTLGFLGEPGVNVLELNLALDQSK